MGNMNKKNGKKNLTEEEIDNIVVSQANDDTAWEEPVRVYKTKEAAFAGLKRELAGNND
jgi:hypothetical protein